MDGVLSLQEILHESRRKKQQGIVLKLDFEKAYDKVDWDFLLKCIAQKGFSPKWGRWVDDIVRGGTLSVKINNVRGRDFASRRGGEAR